MVPCRQKLRLSTKAAPDVGAKAKSISDPWGPLQNFQARGSEGPCPGTTSDRPASSEIQRGHALVSLRVANAAPCRSVSHVDRGWWASFSAQCCCRGWASFSAHIWTSGIYFHVCHVGAATIRTIGRRVEHVVNHLNHRSRSGICCRVQTSFSPF